MMQRLVEELLTFTNHIITPRLESLSSHESICSYLPGVDLLSTYLQYLLLFYSQRRLELGATHPAMTLWLWLVTRIVGWLKYSTLTRAQLAPLVRIPSSELNSSTEEQVAVLLSMH